MKLKAIPLFETINPSSSSSNSIKSISSLEARQFIDLLDSQKAILFQKDDNNNDPFSIEEFGSFVMNLKLKYYPYVGGAAPRRIIPVKAGEDIVFTANESPPDQPIPFHHELAQVPDPPEYIFFYCEHPSEVGGETPIIDSTKVYRYANETFPEYISKLKEHGARYIRTLTPEDDPSSPIGRSYKNTWNVSTPEELNEKLSKIDGCKWEWVQDGCVRITSEPIPAIRLVTDHAQNHVFQWTFANSIIAAFLGWQDTRNDRKDALRFGNGDRMPDDVLQAIADFMDANKVSYKWQKGDIMALNNKLVMHSRSPFVHPRKVLASIWGPPIDELLLSEPPNGIAIGHRPQQFYRPMSPPDPLIFGFWKVPRDQCEDVAYQAIASGYRRLDCACDYGNEAEVGRGIRRALADGLCSREDLFVTSKLWNTYHSPEHVPLAFARTMSDLQLDYLDEYLIHFPISMEFVPFDKKYPPEWTNLDNKMVVVPNDMTKTWAAMEQLVDQGLVTRIGVSNFSTQLLRQLLSTCRIRPCTLQIELHPHNTQQNLIRFARDAGMNITAFSVFGPSSYVELGMAQSEDSLMNNDIIKKISKSKNKSCAQILLRWALQRNTYPLSKTSSMKRMIENRTVFDFYLTGSEMEEINSLNKNRRYNDPGAFCEPGMGTFCPIYE